MTNLLLDKNNLVVMSGTDLTFSYLPSGGVQVLKNGAFQANIFSLNESNSMFIQVEDIMVPNNVVRHYKFINGDFVQVIDPDPQMKDVAEYLLYDIPKIDAQNFADGRVGKVIEFWKFLVAQGVTYANTDPDLNEGMDYLNYDPSVLTPEQILKRNKAMNYVNKLTARYKIESAVGDLYDLVADLSKKFSMLNRLALRVSLAFLTGEPVPEPYATEYLQFIEEYLTGVEYGQVYDRGDLESNTEMFTTLTGRDVQIADIVKNDYFDKLLPEE